MPVNCTRTIAIPPRLGKPITDLIGPDRRQRVRHSHPPLHWYGKPDKLDGKRLSAAAGPGAQERRADGRTRRSGIGAGSRQPLLAGVAGKLIVGARPEGRGARWGAKAQRFDSLPAPRASPLSPAPSLFSMIFFVQKFPSLVRLSRCWRCGAIVVSVGAPGGAPTFGTQFRRCWGRISREQGVSALPSSLSSSLGRACGCEGNNPENKPAPLPIPLPAPSSRGEGIRRRRLGRALASRPALGPRVFSLAPRRRSGERGSLARIPINNSAIAPRFARPINASGLCDGICWKSETWNIRTHQSCPTESNRIKPNQTKSNQIKP